MKKVLFYNWIPFDEKEGKGGGVTIYTRNLIRSFSDRSDWQVYFLSSGRNYDLVNRKPRIQPVESAYEDRCRSFEIVNSPVFSSARISFPFPSRILEDRSLLNLLIGFFRDQGGFDVVHFQNFEGLSVSVFELKKFFPETRFIYSLHNYYPFCPQVMLWRGDRENCMLGHCGSECLECMPKDVFLFKVRLNQYITHNVSDETPMIKRSLLIKLQNIVKSVADRKTKQRDFSQQCVADYGGAFRRFEEQNVENINRYMDAVLAVSERVALIAKSRGINEEKIIRSYIGTDVAKGQLMSQRVAYDGKRLNICYLGYMRSMKGFYFLLDALEMMPSDMTEHIGVVVASPRTDEEAYERLMKLGERFLDVKYYDGYSHDQLDEILRDVHLGIVPPLWEDNLPQVAIEMKAKGVAVLSSDLGGAHELSGASEFVFRAGDHKDFYEKLGHIMDDPGMFDKYWKKQMRLMTMEEHISQLERIYRGDNE